MTPGEDSPVTVEEFDNGDTATEQEAEQLLDSVNENVFDGDDYDAYGDYQSADDEEEGNVDEIFDGLGQASTGGVWLLPHPALCLSRCPAARHVWLPGELYSSCASASMRFASVVSTIVA